MAHGNLTSSIVLALLLTAVPAARSEILVVSPADAVVLPADTTGVVRVALRFDVTGIAEGEGRRIDGAVLDWPVAGMAADRLTEYTLHRVTETWTVATVQAGTPPAFTEEPADLWEYSPRDYEANGGGLLRFHLDALVEEWLADPATNHGVAIATVDLPAAAFAGQLQTAVLTIRYGFVN